MAILIRNLTSGQKGMSKPTTTTGVPGTIEICDMENSSVTQGLPRDGGTSLRILVNGWPVAFVNSIPNSAAMVGATSRLEIVPRRTRVLPHFPRP